MRNNPISYIDPYGLLDEPPNGFLPTNVNDKIKGEPKDIPSCDIGMECSEIEETIFKLARSIRQRFKELRYPNSNSRTEWERQFGAYARHYERMISQEMVNLAGCLYFYKLKCVGDECLLAEAEFAQRLKKRAKTPKEIGNEKPDQFDDDPDPFGGTPFDYFPGGRNKK